MFQENDNTGIEGSKNVGVIGLPRKVLQRQWENKVKYQHKRASIRPWSSGFYLGERPQV